MAENRNKAQLYPTNEEQGRKFAAQMVKLIHTDEKIKEILQTQSQQNAQMNVVLGGIAAQILTLLFTKLTEQTGGMKVRPKWVVEIIRVAVKELSILADSMGMDTPVEDEQVAAQIAGDTLDANMKELYKNRGKTPRPQQSQGQVPQQGAPQPQGPAPQQGMMQQAQGGM